MQVRAALHQAAHQIVRDLVHEYFAFDEFRALAPQDVHGQVGLNLLEVQLDLPALPAEFPQLLCGVQLGIDEGG